MDVVAFENGAQIAQRSVLLALLLVAGGCSAPADHGESRPTSTPSLTANNDGRGEGISSGVNTARLQLELTPTKVTSDVPSMFSFGVASAVDGNFAAVGGIGGVSQQGSVSVYERNNGGWMEQALLAPSSTNELAWFGMATDVVDFSGQRIAVGAPASDDFVGRVYLFTHSGNGVWSASTISSSDATASQQFGFSVALQRGQAWSAVGAPLDSEAGAKAGAVYMFQNLSQQAKLLPNSPGECFGHQVALSDYFLAIGAPCYSEGTILEAGRVYLFGLVNNSWVLGSELSQPDGLERNGRFGQALDISGDGRTMVVGAPGVGPDDEQHGEAYVFERDDSDQWTHTATLASTDPDSSLLLGSSVALSDDLIVLGAPGRTVDGMADAGGALVFHNNGSEWVELSWLVASDPAGGAHFGGRGEGNRRNDSIDISDEGTVIVGAEDLQPGGAAYIFDLPLAGLPGDGCSQASDCAPGVSCVDGVCCDSPCDGPCKACTTDTGGAADGQCVPIAEGTQCGEPLCQSASAFQPAGSCDDAGSCVLAAAEPCAAGTICVDGAGCERLTCNDTICPQGTFCVDGICIAEDDQPAPLPDADEGCGCRLPPASHKPPPLAWLFLLALGVGLIRRRTPPKHLPANSNAPQAYSG